MNNKIEYVQNQWLKGLLPGVDCILYGDGKVTIANAYRLTDVTSNKSKQYWHPLCDTTIDSLENYESDIWTNIDIFHGAIKYREGKIVFGDGSMGNEGFVASIDEKGLLNWAIFFTFSNPIMSAKIENETLICVTELKSEIEIKLDELTRISVVESRN